MAHQDLVTKDQVATAAQIVARGARVLELAFVALQGNRIVSQQVAQASVAPQEDQTVSPQVAQAFFSSSEPVALTVAQHLVLVAQPNSSEPVALTAAQHLVPVAQPNRNITQREAQRVARVMVRREKIMNVAQRKARIVASLVARGTKANIAQQESSRRVRDAQVEVARVARTQSQDDRNHSAIVRSWTNELFYYVVKIPSLIDIGATPFREGDMGMDDAVEISFASAAEIPVLSRPQDRRARQPPDKTRARARTAASTTRHHLQLSAAMSVYCCLNPNECTSSEVAFSAAASVHPEKIIVPTSASEGDQRPQTIVESYPVPVLIVEFISASRTEREFISTSLSEGEISQLIVEFILASRTEGAHRIHSVGDTRRKPLRKPPDKFHSPMAVSEGGESEEATDNSKVSKYIVASPQPSASEGGKFITLSTSESARNRLTSPLVRVTAIKLAKGLAQLTIASASLAPMGTSVATGAAGPKTARQARLAIAIVPDSTVAAAALFIAVGAASDFVGASVIVGSSLVAADIATIAIPIIGTVAGKITLSMAAIAMAMAEEEASKQKHQCVWSSVVGGLHQHQQAAKNKYLLAKYLWRQRASVKIFWGTYYYMCIGPAYGHLGTNSLSHLQSQGFAGTYPKVCLTVSFPRECEKTSSLEKLDISIFKRNSTERKLTVGRRANRHTISTTTSSIIISSSITSSK